MNDRDELFFKTLGARLASARKAQRLTQQQVADQLGIAQQTYAHYEIGRVRFPASMLPELAQILGLSAEEVLLQTESPKAKRGPTPKLQRQLERINNLPKAQWRVLTRMIEAVLTRAGC